MDLNTTLFKIINSLIKLENNSYSQYNYNNFIQKKRNFNPNTNFNIENLNIYNNLNITKDKYKSLNENKNKEILEKKINYFISNVKKEINSNFNNIELFNNEMKIIKNNKTVFMNKFLIKEKKNKLFKDIKYKRRSKYRGVSKNGIGWQVLMKFKSKKSYIGTYYSEELAARIYDVLSIKRMGINAKTNFLYDNEKILKILKLNIDFKSPDISKIISELIK